MTIDEIQEEIVDEFSIFDNWIDKYEYIIDLGKDLPLINAQYKSEEHLIKGCQSRVWLKAEKNGDTIDFTADSDAVITKGIIALLIRVLSGQSPNDIAQADLYFIDQIGLKEHLSMTRSNGLVSMVRQMKLYGIAMGEISIANNSTMLDKENVKRKIIQRIKTVFDPEIPVDIYELGLIYEIEIDDDGKVAIKMTLTSPMCPVADSLPMEVQEKIYSIEEVTDVDLQVVFDPPWTKDMMSDEAKLDLDLF